MRYLSTRGLSGFSSFSDTVAQGLAPDGGLFLPEKLPSLQKNLSEWKDLTYPELCFQVIQLFATDIPTEKLKQCINLSFSKFSHPKIAPLIQLDENLFVLELFHGPTLSFKDYPLQILGNLYENQIERTGIPINILGATSGDTGSAAIHSILGKKSIRTFILYPQGRIAPLQERQMTCTGDPHIFPLALEGSFDDCQTIVKRIFNDHTFKDPHHLSAVNSINWARLACQLVYYVYAWLHLPDSLKKTSIEVAVPSGNFGNVFSGWLTQNMGLPIQSFRIATNQNDILDRLFKTGIYEQHPAHSSLAPSMDIQAASNLERYLYYLFNQDTEKVRAVLEEIAKSGHYKFSHFQTNTFRTSKATDSDILKIIQTVYARYNYIIDPHTACAFQDIDPTKTTIVLATAHPAKFTKALQESIGTVPIHPILEGLKTRPILNYPLKADPAAVKSFISKALD